MSKEGFLKVMGADGIRKNFLVKHFPRNGLKQVAAMAEFDGVMLILLSRGTLYAYGRIPRFGVEYMGWSWPWIPRLAFCLRRLGLISEEDEQATVDIHRRHVREKDIEHQIRSLRSTANDLGILDGVMDVLRKHYPPGGDHGDA